MGEQVSERESLARVLFERANPGQQWAALLVGARRKFSVEARVVRTHRELADAALAWFAERVEALIDRYDDPGYGMQEDEWRFVRDLRALYATTTTESEDR